MIKESAYAEGLQAAWSVFSKEAAPFKPPTNMQVFRGPRVAAQTGSAPVMGAVAHGGGPMSSASPGQMMPQNVGPGVTKKPQLPAPAAPAAPGAAPPAPAAAAAPAAPASPAAAAAPGGFMQSLKEQAPGALLNTGLMMGIPMAMNAFSGSGNQNQ